jgi:hypothetical protein
LLVNVSVVNNSYNNYEAVDSENATTFGTIAVVMLGVVVGAIVLLDIFTIEKDWVILKRNLSDMVLNLKYGFSKEPDVIYVRKSKRKAKSKSSRPKTAVATTGVGMFKIQISRPVYYKTRKRLVSARKQRAIQKQNEEDKEALAFVPESGEPELDTGEPVLDPGEPVLDTVVPALDTGEPDWDTGDSALDKYLDLDFGDSPRSSLQTPVTDSSLIISPRDIRPSYYSSKMNL